MRVGVGTGFGLDVFYLAFCGGEQFFAIDAQASLVGVQIGFHRLFDGVEFWAAEVGHGGCGMGRVESS